MQLEQPYFRDTGGTKLKEGYRGGLAGKFGCLDANLTIFRERDGRSALTMDKLRLAGPLPHHSYTFTDYTTTAPNTSIHRHHGLHVSSDCRSFHRGPSSLTSAHRVGSPSRRLRQSPLPPQTCRQPQANPGRSTRRTSPTMKWRRRRLHLSPTSKQSRRCWHAARANGSIGTSRC